MKKLDQEIQKVHESYWTTEAAASTNKAVLLVEGDDDRDLIEAVFYKRTRTWDKRARIVVAGGRKHVMARMSAGSTFPHAWGLVDRDTWADVEVAEEVTARPLLHVTQGWCLENMFLRPEFLRQFNAKVATMVAIERERWVRAGAFWWALQRAREAQQRWQDALEWDYGKPRDDLDLSSAQGLVTSLGRRIPDDVRKAASLDLDFVAETFTRHLDLVANLPDAEQWQIGVHGKRAFHELLIPTLERHAPPSKQASEPRNWRRVLARHDGFGRPAPLDTLMAVILP